MQMELGWPSTSTGTTSRASPWSGEVDESVMVPPSTSTSKRTDELDVAMELTRLRAPASAETLVLTEVRQVEGRSCL